MAMGCHNLLIMVQTEYALHEISHEYKQLSGTFLIGFRKSKLKKKNKLRGPVEMRYG